MTTILLEETSDSIEFMVSENEVNEFEDTILLLRFIKTFCL